MAGFAIGVSGQGENQLQRPGQHRRGRRVTVSQPRRERVEQHIDGTRGLGTGRGRARGLGCLRPGVRVAQFAYLHCSDERLQVRLARQPGVERLQPPGRAEQQPGRVARAVLVKGDLPAQVLHPRGPQGVGRTGLNLNQQPQRRIQRAGVTFGPGGRKEALRAAGAFGCQYRGALQKRGRGGQAPARLRPAGRPLKLPSDVLVGPGRGVGPVPGAAVRINLRVGDLRQHPVRVPALVQRR